jgi:hypothetical protein
VCFFLLPADQPTQHSIATVAAGPAAQVVVVDHQRRSIVTLPRTLEQANGWLGGNVRGVIRT